MIIKDRTPRICALLAVLSLAIPAVAKDAIFANKDVKIVSPPGCPVEILSGRSFVMEETVVQVGRISGAERTGKFNFTTAYRNTSDRTIIAVEFRWDGCNGMGECPWSRAYSESDKVKPGSKERANWTGPELGESPDSFRIAVTRVRFDDGSMWEIPQP